MKFQSSSDEDIEGNQEGQEQTYPVVLSLVRRVIRLDDEVLWEFYVFASADAVHFV